MQVHPSPQVSDPDAPPKGPVDPVPWMRRCREYQEGRWGDTLVDEDVFNAISEASLHCAHCGSAGHTLLSCGWTPGLGARHVTQLGKIARGVFVSADGLVHGNQLQASYSAEDWLSFDAISPTTYSALILLQAMERVAITRGEVAVRPGVTCISELRVVVRHAEDVLAEVTDPNARLMFHNALFLGRNDSAFRSLEDLREDPTFNGLTRDDFEKVVNDLFVMNQIICRWIQTRQTI